MKLTISELTGWEKGHMTEKNLTLPFIIKTPSQKEDWSYPAELAYVTFLAEAQRKKTSFLRDKPEKIAYIAKVHYPFWIAPSANACLVIDGLNNTTHEFAFQEPAKTATFIEELKRNSVNPQTFTEALQAQAKATREFASLVHFTFPALIDDKDLLEFFFENLRTSSTFS